MRPRSRIVLFWGLFVLVATATGFAVQRLYETAQREIAAQSERALLQERTRLQQRVQSYTEDVRRSIIAELASFHVDGLGHALRQWDEANEIIVGTFQWEPTKGFPEGTSFPAGSPNREELARLWHQFRVWRSAHPAALAREPMQSEAWHTLVYRTLDNVAFAVSELGYQGENLDIISHAGRRSDPWAGWAGSDSAPEAPWIFWYQAGPDEAVRGCLVDVRPMVKQLHEQITNTASARFSFVAAHEAPSTAFVLPGLPGQRLIADPGDVFLQKESSTRFTALIVALLFGLFLVGAATLAFFTRRAGREAERKITFVTQVSHELRTPLTSIRLFADMLAEPGLPEIKRVKFASTISTESGRLGALIERLLAFNALEKTGKKIVCANVEVGALIRGTVEEMNTTLLAAGVHPDVDLPTVSVFAITDPSTLKQALINLLDNATKYAAAGGSVQIKLAENATSISVSVRDLGPGIPVAIRERLFEPFVQGGQTLTNKSPGVGLGLSLARGMLRQVGANLVFLESSRGAAFEIRLPKAETKS
ncbi:MAG: HAMP domain-containing sensor histidine kinase [Lacunisphaera sp.]